MNNAIIKVNNVVSNNTTIIDIDIIIDKKDSPNVLAYFTLKHWESLKKTNKPNSNSAKTL